MTGRHDHPEATLAHVRTALDSGDPALVEDAYVVLRRAMHRVLLRLRRPDAPSDEGRCRAALHTMVGPPRS